MTNFEYTDYLETPASSAIASLYYNEDEEALVVETHNGALAGYEDVPSDVFAAMVTEYQSRNYGGSLGAYWNSWVKPNFSGFSTVDIDGFRSMDEPSPWWDEVPTPMVVQEASDPVMVVSEGLTEFEVTFAYLDYNDDVQHEGVTVFAADQDEALVLFGKIAVLARYSDNLTGFRVSSVTRFFSE